MKLQNLTYLLSVVVFAGTTALLIWYKNKKVLRRYELILLFLIPMGMLLAMSDFFALEWRAWFYYPDQNLNISFVTPIESYLLAVGIMIFCGAITLVYAAKTDRKTSSLKGARTRRLRRLKLRRA